MIPVNKYNHLVHWKIYYHDPESPTYHRTWSNLDGPPWEAPYYGVVCIVQPIAGGKMKEVLCNANFYAQDEEGKWIGLGKSGLRDREENKIPIYCLKEGRWINTDRYHEIMSRANRDADFGGDGGYNPVEE